MVNRRMCDMCRVRVWYYFGKEKIKPVTWSCHVLLLCLKLCQAEPSRYHMAGTPCVDFSLRGLGLGELGECFLCFLAWASARREQQEQVILQENVKEFPDSLLVRVLGDMYYVDSALLNPSEFGFPVERVRKYVILRHKLKTVAFSSPWGCFAGLFKAPLLFGNYTPDMAKDFPAWDVFFQSEKHMKHMLQELLWAIGRPDSLAADAGCAFESVETLAQAWSEDKEKVLDEFKKSLNDGETGFLETYQTTFQNVVYSLNQNPKHSNTHSSWRTLHTITKNAGIMWSLVLTLVFFLGMEWIKTSKRTDSHSFMLSIKNYLPVHHFFSCLGRISTAGGFWPEKLFLRKAFLSVRT